MQVRKEMLLAGVLLAGLSLGWAVAGMSAPGSANDRNSPNVVALGHRLFQDPHLSADGSIACSGCHKPAHAFSDGQPVSIGVDHHKGTRNTPSLLDVFDGEPLFWDGRRTHLDIAVLDPLVNHVEMGNADIAEVVAKLKADPHERVAFATAFHEGDASVSTANLGIALADYIRSLPRTPDAYDRFESGDANALSSQARQGLRLFTGKAGCTRCHTATRGRFTDDKFHHSGVELGLAQDHLGALTMDAMRRDLSVAALGSAIGNNTQLASLGRFLVTHRAPDVGRFRTPSLRNVALTAPYMHDGSIKTLDGAVDAEIYYRGAAEGKPIALTADERENLLAFLRSLTSSPNKVHLVRVQAVSKAHSNIKY